MKNGIQWKKVTWYSKLLAVILFCLVLLVGMYIGSESEKIESKNFYYKAAAHTFKGIEKFILKPTDSIYPIHIHYPGLHEKFNSIRNTCPGKEIISEVQKDENGDPLFTNYATSLRLGRTNINFKKIDPDALFLNFTLDKECNKVYAIVQYDDALRDIFQYDIYTGNYIQLTTNLYPKFTSIEDAKPAPFFIYAITDKKLLVSFETPTTGYDAYTNFTIHQIFDIPSQQFTKKIEFINNEENEHPYQWLLPPTILDFKHNTLSNLVAENKDANDIFSTLTRKDYDLINETFLPSISLNSKLLEYNSVMNNLFFTCPSKEDSPSEHQECLNKNYNNIFPDKTK